MGFLGFGDGSTSSLMGGTAGKAVDLTLLTHRFPRSPEVVLLSLNASSGPVTAVPQSPTELETKSDCEWMSGAFQSDLERRFGHTHAKLLKCA